MTALAPPSAPPPLHLARARRAPRLRRLVLTAGLLAGLTAAHAQDSGEPFPPLPESPALRLSGFATLGVVHSDVAAPWAFRRDVLQRPSRSGHVSRSVDSRLGLQGNLTLSDNWEAVVQGVLKPIASGAPREQRLEWGFLSWQAGPNSVARFGRVSTDIHLESQFSSVGFAYPWVRPNMEFYGWTSLQSVDGLDFSHSWQQGDRRWRIKAVAGQRSLEVPALAGERITFHGRDMFGVSLSGEQGGFVARLSFMRLKFSFDASTPLAPLTTGLSGIEASPVIPPSIRAEARALREGLPIGERGAHYGTVSLQYRDGPWLAQTEFTRSSGGPFSRHLTGSLAYRAGSVTVFGTGGRALPSDEPTAPPQWLGTLAANPLIGAATAARLQYLGDAAAVVSNLSRVEQRSIGAGLRWDFHEQAAFKVQLDRFKVAPYGGGLWGGNDFQGRRANVLSIVVDTVF